MRKTGRTGPAALSAHIHAFGLPSTETFLANTELLAYALYYGEVFPWAAMPQMQWLMTLLLFVSEFRVNTARSGTVSLDVAFTQTRPMQHCKLRHLRR